MIEQYNSYFNNAKLIYDIKDIYIDKWHAFRHKKLDCVIDDRIVDLFQSYLKRDLFRKIFTTYQSFIMYKTDSYMLRPLCLDCLDVSHFINMLKQHRYYCFGKDYSYNNVQNLIIDNHTFYNFMNPVICKNLNKTIDIIIDIFNIYQNNISLQDMFFNKIFLFNINNIDYILSKGFVNETFNINKNNKLYLYTNNVYYS